MYIFGHKDTPDRIKGILKATVLDLIENGEADTFYVGSQGKFDYMVSGILRELKGIYPHINYAVVLSYMPGERDEFDTRDFSDTIYPEEIATVPKRFAINARNKWMESRADIVVTYVRKSYGGAAKFKELAEKKGKKIINIAGKE